jgi:hypothetical protein
MTIKKLFALFFTLMLASTSNSAFAQEVESPKKGKKGIEEESQDDNESATQKQKKQKEVDQDYIDALAAEKEAKRKAKEEETAQKVEKAKKEKEEPAPPKEETTPEPKDNKKKEKAEPVEKAEDPKKEKETPAAVEESTESSSKKAKKQKDVDQDYLDALEAERQAKLKAKESSETPKKEKEKEPQPVAEEPIEPTQKKTKKQKEIDQDYLDALAAEKEAKKSGTYKKEEIVVKPEVRQIVPLDLGIAPKPKGKPADPVDRSMKGPTGQTVYTSKLGGKYYINALDKKEFLVPEK